MTVTGPRQLLGNMPVESTSFVGRRRLVTEAKRHLRRGRLLTLTGAPGVGKTRLALRVAAEVGQRLADGVWLVELAALTDDAQLDRTVGQVLGVRERPGRTAGRALTYHLADRELLLLLDNCHHLVDSCAALVSTLLAAAPRLRIMTTSREALGVEGEHLLTVPPMSLSDPDLPISLASARHEAVRLFVERANTTRPGFSINAGNRTAIARLCCRLDGIPLAIELAALRVAALSPEQMVERLDDYFEFLSAGSRVAVPRLQPLDVAIDWSFSLCSEPEQQLWVRASVFPSGFDLETAETVCSGNGIAREAVLDLIAELLDKSIITMTSGDTVARYRMIEPIRQYGLRKLRQVDPRRLLGRVP